MSMKSLNARLQYLGGDSYGRLKEGKLWSFRKALKNSYNSRLIETPLHDSYRCLINVNNLKPDYDKKILSVDFSAGLEAGDTFKCLDDDSHWLVYLPYLSETAYLHSEIIRCRYTLEVNGKQYWVYIQGPTETDLRWFQKRAVNINELNLSGTIFIKNDDNTRNYFKRFTKINFAGHTWEVQVTDSISVPGVLELEIQEYYDNPIADLPQVIKQDDDEYHNVIGKSEVWQGEEVGYRIADGDYQEDFEWSILDNDRVKILDVYDGGKTCKVKVHDGAIGTYKVRCGNHLLGYTTTTTIRSKRQTIKGPHEVRPYDIVTYHSDTPGLFSVSDTHLVKIKSNDINDCVLEIVSGKSGQFTIYHMAQDGKQSSLIVDIVSM